MFGFFHICKHVINFKKHAMKGKRIRINTTETKKIKRIIKGAVVTNIVGVIVHKQIPFDPKEQMDYDTREEYDIQTKTKGYYDSDPEELIDFSPWIESGEYIPREFYEKYLHNRIKWLVRPPLEYTVVIDIIIQGDFKANEIAENCRICQGNGWYTDITDSKLSFFKSRGSYKVLQNVVKDLITKIGSSRLMTDYGQRLHLMPQRNFNEEEFLEEVQLEVKEVEEKYLLRQQAVINDIPKDEVLVEIQVVKAIANFDDKVIFYLRIVTEVEDKVFQIKI